MDIDKTPLLLRPKSAPCFYTRDVNPRPRNGSLKQNESVSPEIFTYTTFDNKSEADSNIDSTNESSSNFDDMSLKRMENEEKIEESIHFSAITRRQKLMLIICLITNFLEGCGFSLLAPFFPSEAQQKGMSSLLVGFVFSMFEFIIFVTSPLFGAYITTIGPRFLLFSGTFVGGVCTILFGLLEYCPPGTPFIIISISCRTVGSLGFSALLNSIMAILTNEFPKNVTSCFALLETAYGVGLMVGPAIGGALYEIGGFQLPFYVIGGLILFKGTLLFAVIPQTSDIPCETKSSSISLVRSPMVVIAMMSIAIGCFGIAFIDPTLADHLSTFGLSVGVIGLIFIISPGMYSVCAPILGYIMDRKEYQAPFIILGHLFFGLGFLFLGPSDLLPFLPLKLWTIFTGLVLIGATFGCCLSPTMKCMKLGAAELGFEENIELYGILAGILNSMYSLGAFAGPLVGGIIVDEMGFSWAASIVGLMNIFMSFVAFIFFSIRNYRNRKKEHPDTT